MAFTAIEKVLMNHAVEPTNKVSPGDIITAYVEWGGLHEGWIGNTYKMFERLEGKKLYHPERFGVYLGHHMASATTDEMAENFKGTREWATENRSANL